MELSKLEVTHEYDEQNDVFEAFTTVVILTCKHCGQAHGVTDTVQMFERIHSGGVTAGVANRIAIRRDCEECGDTSCLSKADHVGLFTHIFNKTREVSATV